MKYIATFFSHYDALCFHKLCTENSIPVRLLPVPRVLSSSCGTSAFFESELFSPFPEIPEYVEQIAEEKNGKYNILYKKNDYCEA